jgi:hypothetical protein
LWFQNVVDGSAGHSGELGDLDHGPASVIRERDQAVDRILVGGELGAKCLPLLASPYEISAELASPFDRIGDGLTFRRDARHVK